MIVFAAKVSVRKIVVGVLAVGLVLVGAAALLPKTAEADTAVSAEGAALSAKLKTNEDRVALLTACGWSVESEPVGTQEVQIPDTFDEVYEQYNAIQQAQGLDLTPYQGKRIEERRADVFVFFLFQIPQNNIHRSRIAFVLSYKLDKFCFSGFYFFPRERRFS